MKRFTETQKWDDAWFRKLHPRLKCLWQYLCDNCDAAGVIDPDWDLLTFQIGAKVSTADIGAFEGRVVPFTEGSKLLIRSFVKFQYGELSPDCRAHIPVFRAIEKHRVSIGYPIDYPKGIHTLQEKEEVQETEEETDKDRGSAEGEPEAVQFPPELDTEEFKAAFSDYVNYRRENKFKKLQPSSVAAKLAEMKEWGSKVATEAIKATIANGWQGVFFPKANGAHLSQAERRAAERSKREHGLSGNGPRSFDPMKQQ